MSLEDEDYNLVILGLALLKEDRPKPKPRPVRCACLPSCTYVFESLAELRWSVNRFIYGSTSEHFLRNPKQRGRAPNPFGPRAYKG